jgi:homoserine kinase
MEEMSNERGILGAALSGAGPSVLIFLNPKVSVRATTKKIAEHLRRQGLDAELIPTQIARRGAAER